MRQSPGPESEIHQVRRCVYAGTFDPPTNGHLWMIDYGASLFDVLDVAIGVNPDKRPQFALEERLTMLRSITEPYPNVSVSHFDHNFLIDYVVDKGYNHLLRGLRSTDDFRAERKFDRFNKNRLEKRLRLSPKSVQSVFAICPPELVDTSSSFVKALVGPNGWEEEVADYVPGLVLDALKKHHAKTTQLRP